MSHFTVGVILPKMLHEDIRGVIDELLAPYDETLEVEAYPKTCYCVGNAAKQYGQTMADKLVGTFAEQKILFPQREPRHAEFMEQIKRAHEAKDYDTVNELDEELNERWRAFLAPFKQEWERTEREYTESHPAFAQPRPDCEECDGTGAYMSTYNPQSQWDWYRVGGRWDGCLIGNPQESENGFNFNKKHETVSNNSLPLNELLQRYEKTGELFTFFALVTPEGKWIEKGNMGWWGMVSNEKNPDDWKEQSLRIYSLYAGHDVVLLDAHI